MGDELHTRSPSETVRLVGVDLQSGLSEREASARLARDGDNRLPAAARPSRLKRFAAQLTSPLVLTLIAAAAVAAGVGVASSEAGFLARFGDAVAIVLIVLVNAALGYFQEARAESALAALQKLTAPQARVRRDGQIVTVPSERLVVGDVLELEPGDAVGADARLIDGVDLTVDEAALTGESTPVDKSATAVVAASATVADRVNMVHSGTIVVRGRGRAVVVATGARTELGKIGTMLGGITAEATPLERRLASFGRVALIVCLSLSAVLLGWGWLATDRPLATLLLEAVSLAVAAIPEGLPAITTITLALGMQRMARRGALIRRLVAVETLGTATVIASDKTGTLTENQMTVRELWTMDGRVAVHGSGYVPEGAIVDAGGAPVPTAGVLADLLASAAICNTAQLVDGGAGRWRVVGDPTEVALLTVAAKAKLDRETLLAGAEIVRELPFDGDRKRMSVAVRDDRGRVTTHVKGSVDALLDRATSIACATGVRPLTASDRERIEREAERMSGSALRVLAVCRRTLPPGAPLDADHLERDLVLLGLVGMMDPPRAAARDAVAACGRAGIRVIMITGDHPLTGMAVAREIGLWHEGDQVMRGDELARISDEELTRRVMTVRVFARTTAEDKHRIVRALKARGQVVAMTGDGVNDAPALRESHIGVAMGRTGTDVARQASDLVLADDDFSTIVAAVAEGRAIYRNIQKFIFFLLSSNMGLLVAVFAISFVGRWPPLTPLMILWINLVTNGLPALALGVDPARDDLMHQPPRREQQRLLGGLDYLGVAFVGAVIGGAAITLYALAEATGASLEHARTLAFTVLAIAPLFHAFSCRSPVRSLLSSRPLWSPALLAAVGASAAIHLLALWVPALRPVFHSVPPTMREWLLVLALSAAVVPAVELAKLGRRIARRLRHDPNRKESPRTHASRWRLFIPADRGRSSPRW
jgi:Ca2+-transporting ATPase